MPLYTIQLFPSTLRCHIGKVLEVICPNWHGLSTWPNHILTNRMPIFLSMALFQASQSVQSCPWSRVLWETIFLKKKKKRYFPSSKYSSFSITAYRTRTLELAIQHDLIYCRLSGLTPVMLNFLIFETRVSLFLTSQKSSKE